MLLDLIWERVVWIVVLFCIVWFGAALIGNYIPFFKGLFVATLIGITWGLIARWS